MQNPQKKQKISLSSSQKRGPEGSKQELSETLQGMKSQYYGATRLKAVRDLFPCLDDVQQWSRGKKIYQRGSDKQADILECEKRAEDTIVMHLSTHQGTYAYTPNLDINKLIEIIHEQNRMFTSVVAFMYPWKKELKQKISLGPVHADVMMVIENEKIAWFLRLGNIGVDFIFKSRCVVLSNTDDGSKIEDDARFNFHAPAKHMTRRHTNLTNAEKWYFLGELVRKNTNTHRITLEDLCPHYISGLNLNLIVQFEILEPLKYDCMKACLIAESKDRMEEYKKELRKIREATKIYIRGHNPDPKQLILYDRQTQGAEEQVSNAQRLVDEAAKIRSIHVEEIRSVEFKYWKEEYNCSHGSMSLLDILNAKPLISRASSDTIEGPITRKIYTLPDPGLFLPLHISSVSAGDGSTKRPLVVSERSCDSKEETEDDTHESRYNNVPVDSLCSQLESFLENIPYHKTLPRGLYRIDSKSAIRIDSTQEQEGKPSSVTYKGTIFKFALQEKAEFHKKAFLLSNEIEKRRNDCATIRKNISRNLRELSAQRGELDFQTGLLKTHEKHIEAAKKQLEKKRPLDVKTQEYSYEITVHYNQYCTSSGVQIPCSSPVPLG